MRSRQLAVALLVVLAVTSGVAFAKARGHPEVSVFAPDNEFTPGEEAEFEVFLQNAGVVVYATSATDRDRVTTARDVVVTLDAEDTPVEIETQDERVPAGNLPEGLSSAVTFDVSIDEDAAPGRYRLPVTVTYKYTQVVGSGDGGYNDEDATLRTAVTLAVEDDARFEVVEASAPDLYAPTGPVTLTVENVGSATARRARLAVTSGSDQLTFGDGDTAETFVGDWPAGETRAVTVQGTLADGANRRNYPLSAVVSYESADGEARESESLRAGVTPRADSRFAIADVESSLVVGGDGAVSGTLVNNAGTAARGAVVVLDANSENVEAVETEYAVGDLAAGESAPFGFDLEVSESASGGPRQLTFTVEYRDADGEQRESDPLDVRVEVGDQRDVFGVSPVGATLRAGGSGQLRLDVTNLGDEPVTDVSAKLFVTSPISTSDDEAFVDRLEPGATEILVFGVSAGGAALDKTYPVSVDFQYDDADGDTLLSDTYQVPVRVTVPEDGDGGLPVLPVAAVVVVVLAAGSFLLYQRRRHP